MASGFENYRRYPRFSILAKAVISMREEGGPGKLTAMVNTISQGGMGFYTDVLLEKATPVSVELQFSSVHSEETLEGTIASICTQGTDYFVGISFDREIPFERLHDLVG